MLKSYTEILDNQTNGYPNAITAAGCLALAKLGKDAWNEWRSAYPVNLDNKVPPLAFFENIKFDSGQQIIDLSLRVSNIVTIDNSGGEWSQIDLSGFELSHFPKIIGSKEYPLFLAGINFYLLDLNISGSNVVDIKKSNFLYPVNVSIWGSVDFKDCIFYRKVFINKKMDLCSINKFLNIKFQEEVFFLLVNYIDFSNSSFYKSCNFGWISNSKFNHTYFFEPVSFNKIVLDCDFNSASFAKVVNEVGFKRSSFISAKFNDLFYSVMIENCNFNNAIFYLTAEVKESTKGCNFFETEFKSPVIFGNETVECNFSSSIFSKELKLGNTSNTDFRDTIFNGSVLFRVDSIVSCVSFDSAVFESCLKFEKKCQLEGIGFENTIFNKVFYNVSCSKIREFFFKVKEDQPYKVTKEDFSGFQVVFNECEIKNCKFFGTKFYSPVSFENSTFFPSTLFAELSSTAVGNRAQFTFPPDFKNIHFKNESNTKTESTIELASFPKAIGVKYASESYRNLKALFEDKKNIYAMQKFFKLELHEESFYLDKPNKFLSDLYRLTSDYGFSISKPLLFLLGIFLVSCYLNSSLSMEMFFCPFHDNVKFDVDPILTSIESILPMDFTKITYLGDRDPHPYKDLLKIFDKAVSLIFWFLLGLALRNKFKMK